MILKIESDNLPHIIYKTLMKELYIHEGLHKSNNEIDINSSLYDIKCVESNWIVVKNDEALEWFNDWNDHYRDVKSNSYGEYRIKFNYSQDINIVSNDLTGYSIYFYPTLVPSNYVHTGRNNGYHFIYDNENKRVAFFNIERSMSR